MDINRWDTPIAKAKSFGKRDQQRLVQLCARQNLKWNGVSTTKSVCFDSHTGVGTHAHEKVPPYFTSLSKELANSGHSVEVK